MDKGGREISLGKRNRIEISRWVGGWKRAWIGERGQGDLIEAIEGGTEKIMDIWRDSIETQYSEVFLKYVYIWWWSKWNLYIKEETETKPQLDIFCHQTKIPVLRLGHI